MVSVDFRVVVGALPETAVPAARKAPKRTEPWGAPSGVFIMLRCSSGGLVIDCSCLGGNSGPATADTTWLPLVTKGA